MPRQDATLDPPSPQSRLALIGCYTAAGAPGLSSVCLHPDGRVEPRDTLAMESPSCVVWHPTLPVAYATNETPDGGVTAVAVDESGGLRLLGTAPTGAGPCHAAVTSDGRWLLSADYSGGTVTLIALAPDGRPRERADTLHLTGSGPHPERQQAPHPHMIAADIIDGALVCVDLGTDRLTALTITDDGRLRADPAWRLPAGTGPRQVVAHPAERGALVVGELSATLLHVVLAPGTESDGAEEAAVAVLGEVPTTGTGQTSYPAQVTVTADGSRVVVSNRGPDTLAVFDVTAPSLARVAEHPTAARWPRHFALTDAGVVVAGEQSSTIEVRALEDSQVVGAPVTRFETATPTWIAIRPPVAGR